MEGKVTIGIPVYNVEKYVERAVLSAINQTFTDIEVLILNDASPDNSMAKITNIIQAHPRKDVVRILSNETNQGIGAVRNSIIDHAKGKYLYFLDSDDEMAPEAIETMYNLMQQQPVDFIIASSCIVTPSGKATKNFFYEEDIFINGKNQLAKAYLDQRRKRELVQIPVWNKLFSMDFLRTNQIKCTQGYVYEDSFFTFQTILKAGSCRLIPNMLYSYYVIDSSIAHQGERYFSRHYIDSCLQMMKDMKQLCSQYTEDPIFEKLIINQLSSCYYLTMFILKMNNRATLTKQDLNITAECYPLTVKRLIRFSFKNKLKGFFFLFISSCPSSLFALNKIKSLKKR